jgi:hypothetical protein
VVKRARDHVAIGANVFPGVERHDKQLTRRV